MIKRAFLRIATAQAAYFAASVFPIALLLIFGGTALLPVRDVVRLSVTDENPAQLAAAAASMRNAFPELSVEHRLLGQPVEEVVIERPLSLLPGGRPPIDALVAHFKATTEFQQISIDLVARDLDDTYRSTAAAVIAATAMLLLVFSVLLVLRFPVVAPRLGRAPAILTMCRSAVAWAGILLLGWIIAWLPELLPAAVDPREYARFLSAGAVGLLAACVIIPIAEELLFRRWLYCGLLQDRVPGAIVLQALLFAAPHVLPLGFRGAAAAFGMGLVLAWLYRSTGRIEAPILVHIAHNSLAVLVAR